MAQIMRNHARPTTFTGGRQFPKNRQKGTMLGVFSVCEQNGAEWRHWKITSLPSA